VSGGERTVVHLLRHGEVHNPGGILYGRLPGFRLSEAGEAMAQKAADWFAGRGVTHLVSSPLERAQQTAQPIAAELGLPVRIDDRLIEAANDFQGMKVGGGGALGHPRHWWKLRNPFRPSWGEPYDEIAARMLGALATTRDEARGGAAVLVSHQLPIWTLRRYAEGRRLWHRPDRRQCGLASLTSLTWEDEELLLVTYSEPAGEGARRPGKGA
jgi:broad specificity phosphatase PhoE